MCYRHNCDLSLFGSIEDTEGKPLKSELACAVIGKRVGVWSVPNPGYGVINSLKQMRKRLVGCVRNTIYARREVRRERQGEA